MMNARFDFSSVLVLAALMILSAANVAPAAILYLDNNGATPGFGTLATGTWNASTTSNWSTDVTGSSATGVWTQTGGDDIAVINQVGQTADFITISGTVNANEIRSNVTNQTLQGGTLNLTGQVAIKSAGGGANAIFITATISGSNGLTMASGLSSISGTNIYSGVTTINSGASIRAGATNTLPTGTVITDNGQFVINGNVSQQIAGLNGSGQLSTAAGAAAATRTIVFNRASGSDTFSGTSSVAIVGATLNLTKSGGYTQIFSGTGANTVAGIWTVNGGVLALAKTAGLDNIVSGSSIALNGGSLRLDSNNQVNDNVTLSLAGGTLDLNGKGETLAATTLNASSVIDFGSTVANNTLVLSSLALGTGTLRIDNCDGTWGVGNGNDQLRVLSAPTSAMLAAIRFSATTAHPDGFMGGALSINHGTYFEIVAPVPEPAAGAMLMLLFTSVARIRRRRLS